MDTNAIRKRNLLLLNVNFKTQKEFAVAIGSPASYLSQILNGAKSENGTQRNVGDALARRIEERLKLPYGWMDRPQVDENNQTGMIDTRGKVPLVSMQLAGQITVHDDFVSRNETYLDWISVSISTSPRAFAIKLHNDSMLPVFEPNDVLVVEPELDAHARDYIVVRLGKDAEPVVKQLVQDGSDWYFASVDARLPLKPVANATIIGVVRQSIRTLR
jgi:SOS-response transcriptional repressor LexA